MIRAVVIMASMAAIGFLGAGAFNPDDGFLLQDETLWRIFGITAYAGYAGFYLMPVFALGQFVVVPGIRAGRRRCRRA